jgi:hypothetical protein
MSDDPERETLEFLEDRAKAYRLVFAEKNPATLDVLIDLARFCRANETCAVPGDHDRTMMLLGRHEVWVRLQQHLNLTAEQLFGLYTGRPLTRRTE